MKAFNALVVCALCTLGLSAKKTSAFNFPIQTKQPILAPLRSLRDDNARDYNGGYGYNSKGTESSGFFSSGQGRESNYDRPGARDGSGMSWSDGSGMNWSGGSNGDGGRLSRRAMDGFWDGTGRDDRSSSGRGGAWGHDYVPNSWHVSNGYDRTGNNFGEYSQRHVDGGTLQTFSSNTPYSYSQDKDTHVTMSNNGRPIHAEMTLWDGPHNAPQKVRTYCMDGNRNRFKGTFSGRGTVSIRNTGPIEFPAHATVNSSPAGGKYGYEKAALPLQGYQGMKSRDGALEIQGGGALKTWPIIGSVRSATVELESEGRPVNAVVELWQGPTNVQQVAEIHSQDGYSRPYSMEIDLMDSYYGSSTIAIRNVGPIEFPIIARVSY